MTTDLTHLHALQERLAREVARAHDCRPSELELRQVWIAQLEREIAAERRFLGLPEEVALSAMSDEQLLAELGL